MPQPRPPRHTWPDNPVFQAIQAGFARHHEEHPEFMGVHYLAADQVEECWQLLQQSMRSVSFETLAHVPGYSGWLRGQDWTGAYQRHRRNLQMIGLHDAGRRWVLKNPSHLFALGALLAVYPDALVIQTHRAPRTAIASACSLAAHASAGWSPVFTGEVIGRTQLDLWARGLALFTAERARHDPAHFHDVRYDDLVADPVGTVEAIYQHFALPLTGAAADAIRSLAAASAPSRAGGESGHRYALADFGLTGEEVDERFAASALRESWCLRGPCVGRLNVHFSRAAGCRDAGAPIAKIADLCTRYRVYNDPLSLSRNTGCPVCPDCGSRPWHFILCKSMA